MESNIKNELVGVSSFLDGINPQSINDYKVEFKKAEARAYEGFIAMGKIAHSYKQKICKNDNEKFDKWCIEELSYKPKTVKAFIRYYEIFQTNAIDYGNILEKLSSNKLGAITSLCEYKYTYYKEGEKLSKPRIDTDTESRRKFDTFHMDNFIEQNKDNLKDITLQDLKTLVKEYKITNDLIKEKKQELKESEQELKEKKQELAETYKELATTTAVNDKIKYVQTTIGNIVTKLNVISEDDDYKVLIKDEDIKKELEMNLVSARNKINDLLNEINLEKYNYKNIIEAEII